MIKAAVLKRIKLSKHRDLRSYVTGPGGGATFINKRKEKQRKQTKDSLGYTNTLCPFNIPGNVPLFIFNKLQYICFHFKCLSR